MRITIVGLLLLGAVNMSAQGTSHIRPGDAALAALLEHGRAESPTFRRLTDDLESSGWLIFVQPGRCPDRVMTGCLVHAVGRYDNQPYLRVLVAPAGRHPYQVISTLAHELQHAYEVVSDGHVTDNRTLAEFTKRIASDRFRTSRVTIYETTAAKRIEVDVLQELQRRRRDRTE